MSKNFEYFNNALNTQSASTWRGLENYIGFNSKVRVYNLPLGYFMNKVEGKFIATVIGNQIFIEFKGQFFDQNTTERSQQLPDILLNNINMFALSGNNNLIRLLKSERRVEKIPLSGDIEFNHHLILRNITIPPEWTLIEEYDLFNGSYSNSELGTQISTLSNLVSSQSAEIEKLKAKGNNSDSGFVMEINESATLIAKVKEKESGKIVLELSTEIEDFEVKFDLTTSNNEKRSYHVSHNNPVEIDLPEKLSNTYNSWGLHLYREVLDISNFRAKTVNNYRSKEISFESNEFKIYSDTCDIVTTLGGSGVEEVQKADMIVSKSMKFYVAVIKSTESDENTFCIYSSNTSEKLDTEFLDGIKQNPLSLDITITNQSKSSILSWYKVGSVIDRVDNNSREEGIRVLSTQRYNDYNYTLISPQNNISSVSFLSFNKLFSDDEKEICKVKTINIEQINDLNIMNPIIVDENELKSFGSSLDKKGHPYRISLNADNLLLLFAFRTNLSEWLITHSYDNVFNNANYGKLPGRITGKPDRFTREDKTFLLNNNNYAYRYDLTSNTHKEQGYFYLNNIGLETNSVIKCYIGDTVESLKENGSLEVYSLEPFKYKNSGLKTIFDSFSDISTIISSLVNTETGENLPVQNEDYIKLQNARMCCHQTISWDSGSSTPKVTNVEFITLSEMVKIFISKSSEYLRTHEPTLNDYPTSLQKAKNYADTIHNENDINESIQNASENLEWIKNFRRIYNKLKDIYSKDISKFKSEFESSEDKTKVMNKISDYLFTEIEDKITTGIMPNYFRASSIFIPYNSDDYNTLNNFYSSDRLEIKKPHEGDYIYYNSFEDLKDGMLNYSIGNSYGGSSIDRVFSDITEDKINKVENIHSNILREVKRYKDLRLYEKYDSDSLRDYLDWGIRL